MRLVIQSRGGLLALAIVLATFMTAGLGHHSFTYEYTNEVVEHQGEVTEVWYANPHSRVYIHVADENGDSKLWEFETYPTIALERAGWYHNTLKEGDAVRVSGRLARDGGNRAQMIAIVRLSDGWEGLGYRTPEER